MDIYCPKCGEPIDIDELHGVAAELETTFSAVMRDFQIKGCNGLLSQVGYKCSSEPDTRRADAASVMYDLLGDDIDGAASMLDDFEYMGMLD